MTSVAERIDLRIDQARQNNYHTQCEHSASSLDCAHTYGGKLRMRALH